MTTQVLARESVVTKARPRTVARDPFFAAMSAVILAIVLSGFAPTLYLRPVFKPLPIPGYLYLHGIVLLESGDVHVGQPPTTVARAGADLRRGRGQPVRSDLVWSILLELAW